MPACWPASRDLTKKTVLYYSNQRSPYWPFCLFCSETCLVLDWFYSYDYCLWSTITTPPMLSLEKNKSSDLTAFDWTTLKRKPPKENQISPVRRLCWDFPYWNSVFASRQGGAAAEHPCADVYKWTWKSSRALSPLLTSLCRMLRTCKHVNMHIITKTYASSAQTNTHAQN